MKISEKKKIIISKRGRERVQRNTRFEKQKKIYIWNVFELLIFFLFAGHSSEVGHSLLATSQINLKAFFFTLALPLFALELFPLLSAYQWGKQRMPLIDRARGERENIKVIFFDYFCFSQIRNIIFSTSLRPGKCATGKYSRAKWNRTKPNGFNDIENSRAIVNYAISYSQ